MADLQQVQEAFAAGLAHGRKLDGCAPDSTYTDPGQCVAYAHGYAEGTRYATARADRSKKYRGHRRYERVRRIEHR